LSLWQQLGILAVLLLTSMGVAGVTGPGFIVLSATLSSVETIPISRIMPIFGIDKFMSEYRTLTNLCGNSVVSIVVSRWADQFDAERARKIIGATEDELEIAYREEGRSDDGPGLVGIGGGTLRSMLQAGCRNILRTGEFVLCFAPKMF
jgi:hypothetical protein